MSENTSELSHPGATNCVQVVAWGRNAEKSCGSQCRKQATQISMESRRCSALAERQAFADFLTASLQTNCLKDVFLSKGPQRLVLTGPIADHACGKGESSQNSVAWQAQFACESGSATIEQRLDYLAGGSTPSKDGLPPCLKVSSRFHVGNRKGICLQRCCDRASM